MAANMTERMTRAQRAAIGPAAVRAQGTTLLLTPAQQRKAKQLREQFGKGFVKASGPLPYTKYMMVTMQNAIAQMWLFFDADGHYQYKINQTSPLFEGTDEPATRPRTLSQTDSLD